VQAGRPPLQDLYTGGMVHGMDIAAYVKFCECSSNPYIRVAE